MKKVLQYKFTLLVSIYLIFSVLIFSYFLETPLGLIKNLFIPGALFLIWTNIILSIFGISSTPNLLLSFITIMIPVFLVDFFIIRGSRKLAIASLIVLIILSFFMFILSSIWLGPF